MNFEAARTQMLGQQIRAWDVLDDRVLRALRETPRELFVPESYRDLAFADAEIPLGHDQAMLAPKIEGRVLQALRAEPIDDALLVGTGSGFLTACLSRLAKQVLSVDIVSDFVAAARSRLDAQEIGNVTLEVADALEIAHPGRFDVIAVTGSVPEIGRAHV